MLSIMNKNYTSFGHVGFYTGATGTDQLVTGESESTDFTHFTLKDYQAFLFYYCRFGGR